MKKGRGALFQRMLAVLLSAVLVTGMVANAAPMTVLAGENGDFPGNADDPQGSDLSGSVSGNDAELTEETNPGEQTPDAGTGPEAPGAIPEEAEPETVPGNDAQPETMAAPQGVMRAGEEQTTNTTLKVTLHVHGYLPGRFSYQASCDDSIQVKSITPEAVETLQEYAVVKITFGLNVTGEGDFSLTYGGHYMLVSDPISPGGEINWGPIDVWPVRLKDGEKVLDLFYVGNGWVFDKPQASPEKSGYTFSHWENSEGKKAFVNGFLAGQEQINGATDFYASWIQDQDKGWTFDQNRKLTIESDAGMDDWVSSSGRDPGQVMSVEIKSGVSSIKEDALKGCYLLTSITIPESVTSIEDDSFNGCDGLTEVTLLGETPPALGTSVFAGCGFVEENKKGIHVPEGKAETYKNAAGWDAWAAYIAEDTPTDTNLASGEGWTLDKDGKLTITSDTGVTGWKNYGGFWFDNVVNAEIQDGVTSIDYLEFNDCDNLAEITIADSVKCIKERAFDGCGSLTKVIMKSETPPALESNVFRSCKFVKDNTKGILVPEGKAETYKNATDKGWGAWAEYIEEVTPPAETHEHNGVTFTAWTEEDSLPDTAGNFYLTKDVTISSQWATCPGEQHLCLNGHTIRLADAPDKNSPVICIYGEHTLNLYDCEGAGRITGGADGGVFGAQHSKFRMYGGIITGNSGSVSGVQAQGAFCMYGGEISGNSSTGSGRSALTTTQGGTITVGWNAVITGNTNSEGKAANLRIGSGDTIIIENTNPLSGNARIGITSDIAPTAGNPVSITGANGADYSSCFTSDKEDYAIANGDRNEVLLVAHTHELILTPAKPATCTEDGNEAYYVCSGDGGCGKWFSDEAGTQEIEDKDSVVIPKTGHSYDMTKWGYQTAEGHAHICRNCNEHDDVQPHTPGAPATETTHQTCTVCGYEMAPATGTEPGSGNVKPEVKPGANTPEITISAPEGGLADVLLTEEEKRQLADGTEIRIILEVKDVSAQVSEADRVLVEGALKGAVSGGDFGEADAQGYILGQYLDISLYKVIGGADSSPFPRLQVSLPLPLPCRIT